MILLEADKKHVRTSLPQGQRIIGKKDVKKNSSRYLEKFLSDVRIKFEGKAVTPVTN